ncbi:MAG: NlpC/P60 family protein [Caldicoprobacterales bacterium]
MKIYRSLLCVVFLSLLLILPSFPTFSYTGNSTTLYSMYINGQQVGTVRFPARALAIYDSVEKAQRDKYQEEVFIDSKIRFSKMDVGISRPTDDKALAKTIEETIDVQMNSISISIDGTRICHVKDMKSVRKIIDEIKAPYIQNIEEQENSQLEDIAFKENLNFKKQLVSVKDIISPEEAVNIILRGKQEYINYQVQENDTLQSIASQNKVSLSDLQLINPQLEDNIIKPGDIIKIEKRRNLLTVITREKVQYSEEIPYETEVRNDNNLEKGKTKVIQQGQKGQKDIVALVTKEDGQEVTRNIVEEKVVKEPVKHIEAKGTKEKPKLTTSTRSDSTSGSSNTSTSRSGSGTGRDVVAFAMKYKGYRYSFGSSGPNAFDCSGFTKYVYKQFGVNLPHSSTAQRSVGKAVSKNNLQPGDILCFPGHVGIYIGGNKFIHASNERDGVKVSTVSSFNRPLITARRIF